MWVSDPTRYVVDYLLMRRALSVEIEVARIRVPGCVVVWWLKRRRRWARVPMVSVLLEVEGREEIEANRGGRLRRVGWSRMKHRRAQSHDNKQVALFCGPPTIPFVLHPPPKRRAPTSKCVSLPSYSHRRTHSHPHRLRSRHGLYDGPLKQPPLAGSSVKTPQASETTDDRLNLGSQLTVRRLVPSTCPRRTLWFLISVSTDAPSPSSPPSFHSSSSLSDVTSSGLRLQTCPMWCHY